MIQHVFTQLKPHFDPILVSANDSARFDFLEAVIVPDKIANQGPLMGIVSCLEVSPCDFNFVVACDIPIIDIAFVQWMLHCAMNYDCLVPVNDGEHIEPLFAVYRKSALDALGQALAAGQRRIRDALARCNTQYVELPKTAMLRNINTARDYEGLLARPLQAKFLQPCENKTSRANIS